MLSNNQTFTSWDKRILNPLNTLAIISQRTFFQMIKMSALLCYANFDGNQTDVSKFDPEIYYLKNYQRKNHH